MVVSMCCCVGRGGASNPKRVYRLYREIGLQLRNKPPKRRVKAKLREDRRSATQPNETWAMDLRPRGSRRRSNLGLTSAALTLWRYSKTSAGKSDSRRQSGSI